MESTVSTELVLPEQQRNAITERNQRESPLLRLAPELRNKIYSYAFHYVTVDYTQNYGDRSTHWSTWHVKRDGSNLRFVCKQVHFEVQPYLKFRRLTCDTTLHALLYSGVLGKSDGTHIRDIIITCPVGVFGPLNIFKDRKTLRIKFPTLRYLEFPCLEEHQEGIKQKIGPVVRGLDLDVCLTDEEGNLVWRGEG